MDILYEVDIDILKLVSLLSLFFYCLLYVQPIAIRIYRILLDGTMTFIY